MKINLKSLFILLAFVAAFSTQVNAGYIHWMIDEGSVASDTSYAMLKVQGPSGGPSYLVNYNQGAASGELKYGPDKNLGWAFAPQFSQVMQSMLTSDYKFIIELYDSSDRLLSTFAEYEGSLLAGGYYGSGSGPDSTDIFVFENQNIPEPTSGMLMLFGLGLLALRRKQKKA